MYSIYCWLQTPSISSGERTTFHKLLVYTFRALNLLSKRLLLLSDLDLALRSFEQVMGVVFWQEKNH